MCKLLTMLFKGFWYRFIHVVSVECVKVDEAVKSSQRIKYVCVQGIP
jgi:hypothetical protein